MSFSRTAMWKASAVLLIQAASHSALAKEAPTEFNTVIINSVPDVQIRHADTAQVQMPKQELLAQLLNAEIADGVLTLSCEKNCESLRDEPITISLPNLQALHGHNGGRIQVLSDFPLNKKDNIQSWQRRRYRRNESTGIECLCSDPKRRQDSANSL